MRRSKGFISNSIDKDDQKLVAVTIIPSQPIVQPGRLNKFSIVNLQKRLKPALDKVGLGAAIGGIDLSYNEDRDGEYDPFWCVHVYIVASIDDKDRVKRELKKIYKRDDRITRPVKISKFTNSAWRRSYAYKIDFQRRIGYDETRTGNGITRTYRNTSNDRLRVKERLELVKYVDQCGLGSRVIFRRAKPVPSHGRVRIKAH